MNKKIKIDSLYLVVLGDIKSNNNISKIYTVRQEMPILAHAKYSFFNKGRIKYFKNIVDNTKYFSRESYVISNSLCAVRYCPASIFLKPEDLQKGYIDYDDIKCYIEGYFASKFIQETVEMFMHEEKDRQKVLANELEAYRSSGLKKNASYITTLTDGKFDYEPAIGREKEITNLQLTLAQLKSNPLIIGNPGVGKTTLIDELSYKIQNGAVPNILKNREIIETSAGEILAGSKYRGTMEERMIELTNIVKKRNAILFVDNFHNIFNSGSSEDSSVDIASMIKKMIDRDKIKVIGATTKENYDKFISPSDLKGRFETITLEEPNDALLYEIINYTFDNYSKLLQISLDKINSNITNILIELTRKKFRKYNDEQCNPALVIGIIDKAFGAASAEDAVFLTHDHIISSINANERIYDSKKESIIKEIEELSINNKEDYKNRILVLN